MKSKSILKQRFRNVKSTEKTAATTPGKFVNGNRADDVDNGPNPSKRNVTFDETITVKNKNNLVVKKPMKLQIIIEKWKSVNSPSTEIIIQSNPGIVQRLVVEFTANNNVSINVIK